MSKSFKDPIYGYINIEREYVKEIIDSCEFQRLRFIRQTSYESVYPNSLHNRFVHSLGVFYLGEKAFHFFHESCKKFEDYSTIIEWEQLKDTFELACLLHDVGHTPFSHTGEKFLVSETEKPLGNSNISITKKLYNDLIRTVAEYQKKQLQDFEESSFVKDFNELVFNNKAPKPHEIMSVIVALKVYNTYLMKNKIDGELFARMILGLTYNPKQNDMTRFKEAVVNSTIQMLNSNIIDVDRLEYVIRDVVMTGFKSTSIDYERLLGSICLIKIDSESRYYFGYRKNALSIIENVVIAYDAERQWIQNHPIILYDTYLVEESITIVNNSYKLDGADVSIFQEDALSEKGIIISATLRLRLLSDSDILFLMKQIKSEDRENNIIKEYFTRNERKTPLWKSEAEFNLVLSMLNKKHRNLFREIFSDILEEEKNLDEQCIREIEKELKSYQEDASITDEMKRNVTIQREKRLFWLKEFSDFADRNELNFEYTILFAKKYQSNINRLHTDNVWIYYDSLKQKQTIQESINLYQNYNGKANDDKLFYIFVKPKHREEYPNLRNDFIEFIESACKKYIALRL